jgi:protein-S-isoprenylcysteine O-methyltransferase Ste14
VALLMVPTAITLASAAAIEILIQLQVRLEEAHLHRTHASTYEHYCRRVARWLGQPRVS